MHILSPAAQACKALAPGFCVMPHYPDEIEYSERYNDSKYEYRHVILPKAKAKEMFRLFGGPRLLEEQEWRSIGVQQSRGWGHYEMHRPEPHILLFRRVLGTDPVTGKAPTLVAAAGGSQVPCRG